MWSRIFVFQLLHSTSGSFQYGHCFGSRHSDTRPFVAPLYLRQQAVIWHDPSFLPPSLRLQQRWRRRYHLTCLVYSSASVLLSSPSSSSHQLSPHPIRLCRRHHLPLRPACIWDHVDRRRCCCPATAARRLAVLSCEWRPARHLVRQICCGGLRLSWLLCP